MIIRRYQASDAKAISHFMYRCFIRNKDYEIRSHAPEYYAWKYRKNPWGKPVVWVADEGRQIVGMMAVVPKHLWMNGEILFCGESGDTFMDPHCKGKNIFLDMAFNVFEECHQSGMQFIYGTPNRISYDVVTKLFGYEELFSYRSFVRPLQLGSFIRTKLRNRFVSNILGWPLNAIHQQVFWPRDQSPRFSLERIFKADERLDKIWESIRSQIAFSVIKDRHYVQWRFFDSPESFHVMLIKKDEEPAGFTAFKLTPMKDLVCGHVVDLTVSIEAVELKTLWACLLTELKKLKADFVNTWMMSGHPHHAVMKQIGFIMRTKPFWLVMKSENKKLSDIPDVKNSMKWMFSQADTDNI